MDGTRGLRAWRWYEIGKLEDKDYAFEFMTLRLLIIEGIPSVGLGVFGWFFLADSPETAWYLSESQHELLVHRCIRDQREASTPSAQELHRSDVSAAVKDWKGWAFCLQNFPGDIQLCSYSLFLPTIIKAVNPEWSTLYVQALTVPCFVCSAVVYFAVAFISDARQHRTSFGILGVMISIVGHTMLIAGRGVAVRYLGCFMVAAGIFVVSGIALVWMPTNLPRYGKRSTAVGMQLMIGNSAGIAAPYVSTSVFCNCTQGCDSSSFIPLEIRRGSSWAIW